MDAFQVLVSAAGVNFASTTGVSMQQIATFATSSVLQVYFGSVLDFLEKNAASLIAYTMIGLILLLVTRAFIFYRPARR